MTAPLARQLYAMSITQVPLHLQPIRISVCCTLMLRKSSYDALVERVTSTNYVQAHKCSNANTYLYVKQNGNPLPD
jgi:hypothetical protein